MKTSEVQWTGRAKDRDKRRDLEKLLFLNVVCLLCVYVMILNIVYMNVKLGLLN